jgi:hypothetical protein
MARPFGELGELLARTNEGVRFLDSAGPVSDAFIMSTEPVTAINGPVGSAKTTASIKKTIVEATRIWPWDNGCRTYVPYIYRVKYDLLWKATIPSWRKIFPEGLGDWVGSSPRSAVHTIEWRDEFGPVKMIAHFQAFGESADPEDLRGVEPTDVYLNEIDTMPEALFIAISGRVARTPTRSILRRPGRVFGDLNAPDVTNWTYRDFWEDPPKGYRLYRQPGGLDPNAENPKGAGPEYYHDIIEKNEKRPWYVRRMVHNKPGFTRDADVVYPVYDDDRHLSAKTLEYLPALPVLVGIDGGSTPAAIYMQETPGGQLRVLAEIALESSGPIALSRAMLTLEARRFPKAEFYTVCDPAMHAGHDTEEGSDRMRLSKHLHRPVHLARTNDPERRHEPLAEKMRFTIDDGSPGLLLDPSCRRLRRGWSQTFQYHRIRGSNERGRVVKNPDSHPCEAAEYAAMETGQGHARALKAEREREREARMKRQREAGRYNPMRRPA